MYSVTNLTLTLAFLSTVDLGMCPCGPGPWMGPLCPVDGYCNVKGPAGQAHDDHGFQHLQRIMADCGCCVGNDESGNCCASIDDNGACLDASGEVVGTAAASDESSTQTSSESSEGNRSVGGASVKSNWWMYVVGAATVGLVGAAIVMRKRVRCCTNEAEYDCHVPLFIYSHT